MAIKQAFAQEGFGVETQVDWFGHNFTFIDIGVHYHPKPEQGTILRESELCSFRAGFYITLLGVQISIGRFWKITKE